MCRVRIWTKPRHANDGKMVHTDYCLRNAKLIVRVWGMSLPILVPTHWTRSQSYCTQRVGCLLNITEPEYPWVKMIDALRSLDNL